jgi:hypothetical protein
MAKHLEHLARRLEGDPNFVACPLTLYAQSECLDKGSLASKMRCSTETLTLICLCRAPSGESEFFQDGVDRIAAKYSVDADLLAEAIRRGQAVFKMRQNAESARTLLAARDGPEKGATEDGGAKP